MHGTAHLIVPDRDHVELNLNSDPANLAAARTAIEEFCAARAKFDPKAVGEVGLCVNEALANVMRHAYSGAVDQRINIVAKFEPSDGSVAITIRDWGTGVNPQVRLERQTKR